MSAPRIRADCEHGPRPCPWNTCRYHLARDSYAEPMVETCALDVARRGGINLEETGQILGMTRERIRQIQTEAFGKLAKVRHGRGRAWLEIRQDLEGGRKRKAYQWGT
ncbi:MAG: sigma factor-like helix-turn-helix DNA-binding protein [Pseudomonadota bacterium]